MVHTEGGSRGEPTVEVWVHNVAYKTAGRDKPILDGVSFKAVSGEITAVLGPSGCGKTTALNGILGRLPTRKLSGSVVWIENDSNESGKVDGELRDASSELSSRKTSKRIGSKGGENVHYVMALDHSSSFGFLTVREALQYSARLRGYKTKEAVEGAVKQIVKDLQLEGRMDTIVGNSWVKGLSKGELKRLAIAEGLLGKPRVVVLDEPTTGLDSHLSLELMLILKKLALRKNILVLMTLHQPSTRAFHLIDKMALLSSRGSVVYFGPPSLALSTLQTRLTSANSNFSADDDPNQTDPSQSAYKRQSKNAMGQARGSLQSTFVSVPDLLIEIATDMSLIPCASLARNDSNIASRYSPPEVLQALEDQHKTSEASRKFDVEFAEVQAGLGPDTAGVSGKNNACAFSKKNKQRFEDNDDFVTDKGKGKASPSWWTEFSVIFQRTLKNTLRNPSVTVINLLVILIQACVLGALFYNLSEGANKTTTPVMTEWAVWDSPALVYLTEGIDREGGRRLDELKNMDNVENLGKLSGRNLGAEPKASFPPLKDPLRDLLANGVDMSSGSSLLLDLFVSQPMVDYMSKAAFCLRNTFPFEPLKADDPEVPPYPKWFWPPGSIKGTAPPQELPSTLEEFASLPLETTISMIVGLVQVLDRSLTIDYKIPSLEDNQQAFARTFWFANWAMNLRPYLDPVFCCLGFEEPFIFARNPSEDVPCAQQYPDIDLPTFPGHSSEGITGALKQVLPSLRRLLEDLQPMIATSPVVSHDPNLSNTPNHFPRNPYLAPPSLTSPSSAPPSFTPPSRPHKSAPRRRLGSGLGDMARELVALLFDNPSNPLYPLLSNLREMAAIVGEKCSSYEACATLESGVQRLQTYGSDFAESLLSSLNIAGALFFLVGNIGFMTYDALLHIPAQRHTINKERADGLYRTSSYLLGTMLAELPVQLTSVILWSTVYYFIIGLRRVPGAFFLYLLTCIMTSFTAYSLGYFIAAISPSTSMAVIVMPLILVVMLVVAGFMIRDPQLPTFIAWFRYFSIYRWSFFSLLLVQFPAGGRFGSLPNELATQISGVVETRLWANLVWLLGLSLIFRLLAYLSLKFTNRKIGLES